VTNINGTLSPEGLRFGPTDSGKMYLCYREHRGAGNGRDKSVWIIAEVEEYALFCTADDNNWIDHQDCYWAVKNGEILGTKEERVAKFWDRSPWHGFPVLTSDTKPPKDVIRRWREQGVIGRRLEKLIKQGNA
jgi:hypothetical protein